MIPKVIHYCWFGRNKKSELINKCIESWWRHLSDYKIIEWNEDNFNVYQNDYMREAYRKRKWAYVSDFARMKILYKYGGIYLDTDVEVIKTFPEYLLEHSCFSGIEHISKLVSPGLIFGCQAGNQMVGELVAEYENIKFKNAGVDRIVTINKRVTNYLIKYGYTLDDKMQIINDMVIYPSNYFCGYDGERRITDIKPETISIHHYAASWLPWYRRVRLWLGTEIRHLRYKV